MNGERGKEIKRKKSSAHPLFDGKWNLREFENFGIHSQLSRKGKFEERRRRTQSGTKRCYSSLLEEYY